MQGGHQLAQKFSTTTLPRRSLRCPALPRISVGKSCARFPATEGSPCRYIGRARITKTSATNAITPQAAIFLIMVIAYYGSAFRYRSEPILASNEHAE